MWNFQQWKNAIIMRPNLISLYHKQSDTPLKTENSTTEGFVNSGIKPKHSKTWDIKCHWLIDKKELEKLRVYRDRGMNNDTDYFTKHPPPIHRCQIQPRYIYT